MGHSGKHEKDEKLAELATDIDDIKITADEIRDDPPDGVKRKTAERLTKALDEAQEGADELDNQTKE